MQRKRGQSYSAGKLVVAAGVLCAPASSMRHNPQSKENTCKLTRCHISAQLSLVFLIAVAFFMLVSDCLH